MLKNLSCAIFINQSQCRKHFYMLCKQINKIYFKKHACFLSSEDWFLTCSDSSLGGAVGAAGELLPLCPLPQPVAGLGAAGALDPVAPPLNATIPLLRLVSVSAK